MNVQPISRAALLGGFVARFLAGLVLIGVLLFLPAGTVRFWQAWVYMGLVFVPLAIVGGFLLARDPGMLERRMRMRETHVQQKVAIASLSLLLVAILIIAGFDKRYHWSAVPTYLVLAADALILLGFAIYALTIRENRYASRVIELQQDQKVITTGPYAIVRHPMYLGMGLMFAVSPLALGSYWGLIAGVLFPLLLALRISDEERLLHGSLKGYDEYTRKVKYRLIPFVW